HPAHHAPHLTTLRARPRAPPGHALDLPAVAPRRTAVLLHDHAHGAQSISEPARPRSPRRAGQPGPHDALRRHVAGANASAIASPTAEQSPACTTAYNRLTSA